MAFIDVEEEELNNELNRLLRGLESSGNDTGANPVPIIALATQLLFHISRPGRSPNLHDKNKTINQ